MVKRIRFFLNIKMKFHKIFPQYKIAKNVNSTTYSRNCLLIYITYPFIKPPKKELHQNQWQVLELAKILGRFRYNVDVIDYNNLKVKLKKKYDLIVDIYPGLNRSYINYCSDKVHKIAYLTESNPSFYISQTIKRLDYLKKRRNSIVKTEREVIPFKKDIEMYDFVFFIGNEYNWRSYEEFKMPPVAFITNSGYEIDIETNDQEKKSTNFLFLGSGGQIQKGLDLLLEVFSKENKDCVLYVCSKFRMEKNFCEEYKEELYNTDNIIPIGFIDIRSEEFFSIAKKCSYMILPSCSEARAGSVLTAMSFGLVPIVSHECGYDEEKELFFLEECTIECVSRTVANLSKRDMKWIHKKAKLMQNIVKERYGKENYSKSVVNAMKKFEKCMGCQ